VILFAAFLVRLLFSAAEQHLYVAKPHREQATFQQVLGLALVSENGRGPVSRALLGKGLLQMTINSLVRGSL